MPACLPSQSSTLVNVWIELGNGISNATIGKLNKDEAVICRLAMNDALKKECLKMETSEERCAHFVITTVSGEKPDEALYEPLEYGIFALRAYRLESTDAFIGREGWIRDTIFDNPHIDPGSQVS